MYKKRRGSLDEIVLGVEFWFKNILTFFNFKVPKMILTRIMRKEKLQSMYKHVVAILKLYNIMEINIFI